MNAIVQARIKKRMTQKRLAYEAGIAARTLRKLERGEEVSLDTLNAVYKVLGITSVAPDGPTTKSLHDRTAYYFGGYPETKAEYVQFYIAKISIICICCLAVAYPLVLANTLYSISQIDAVIDVYLDGRCDGERTEKLARTLEENLVGTTVLSQRVFMGTDGCRVRVQLNTEEGESSLMDKLSRAGVSASLTQESN